CEELARSPAGRALAQGLANIDRPPLPGKGTDSMPLAKSSRRSLLAAVLLSTYAGACAPNEPTAHTDARSGGDAPGGDIDAPIDAQQVDAPLPPPAQDYIYVSPLGNDLRNGTSPIQAKLTISAAISTASACMPRACTVRIAEGTYDNVNTLMLANDVD